MATKKIEIQDSNGNVYYPHTDASVVKNGSKTVAEQLNENTQEIFKQSKSIQVPYNYTGAVITFVDDDGSNAFLTNLKPTFDSYGCKCSLGIIPSFAGTTGYMTKEILSQLQDEGYEIISHSNTHASDVFNASAIDLTTVSDVDIEKEYKDSQDWLITNGFNGFDVFVYPWGNFGTQAIRYKQLARKYYKYAVNAVGSYNETPVDNMYMDRQFLNKTQDISVYTALIDEAIANNAWLIFGTHGGNTSQIDGNYLGQILTYVQTKNIPILTFKDALKYKGNALSIGDRESKKKFYVGNDGTVINDYSLSIAENYSDTNGYTFNTLLTSFQDYTITVSKIKNIDDTLTSEGGTLITHTDVDGSSFSYQEFTSALTLRTFKRKWNDSTNLWGTWLEYTLKSYVDSQNKMNIIEGIYTGTMDDSITSYQSYKFTISQIRTSNDTLAGEGGVLETFRGGMYFSYQKFISTTNCKVYYRNWVGSDDNGSWGVWKLITT
ncbi:MAG: polysaccharide deacetylase family protein [Clostridium butyricum]|nr:polysaccharide deacetylase family protein [Clostridium butyricum]